MNVCLERNTKYIIRLFFPIVLLIGFIVSYLFAYKMVQFPWTDLAIHTNWANEFWDGTTLNDAYPGYYLVYGLLYKVCGIPSFHTAGISLGLFSVLTGITVYVITGFYLGWSGSEKERCLIVLFMSFFGPLYLGGSTYYVGQGSFNTWHNPTNSGVKFLALICFFLFVYTFKLDYKDKISLFGKNITKIQLNLILSAFTCLSLLFKPSFFQVFAPSLAVIYAKDFLLEKRPFKMYFKDALFFIPPVLIILYQMFAVFGSDDAVGGMYIYFARGWSFHSKNIFRSILTQAIFPVFVFIFCERDIKKNSLLNSAIIFYLVGIGEALFLVESGSRVSHGNFLWGNNLGIGIVFLAAILTFIRYVHRTNVYGTAKDKIVKHCGYGILLAHFLLGTWYIIRCYLESLEYF